MKFENFDISVIEEQIPDSLINECFSSGHSEYYYEVMKHTSKLSERQQQCIELTFDGLSQRDIAKKLHISRGSVTTHLERAIKHLRKMVNNEKIYNS